MLLLSVKNKNKELSDYISVSNQCDVNLVIDHLEKVALLEFEAIAALPDEELINRPFNSSALAMAVRRYQFGELSLVVELANAIDNLRSGIVKVFDVFGHVYFSPIMSYSHKLPNGLEVVSSDEIFSIPEPSSIVLNKNSANLVLENANTIDPMLSKYLSSRDISYSAITALKYVDKEKLMDTLNTISKNGRINLYLSTTGTDRYQVDALAPLLATFCKHVSIMSIGDLSGMINALKSDYPHVVFESIGLDLAVSKEIAR